MAQTHELAETPFRWLPESRRRRLALALILALALATRLLLWSLPQHLPANDEAEYLAAARDLAAGRGWQLYAAYPWLRAPLYPLWLAGSLGLAGGDPQMALLPQILLSVAQLYGLWLLGRELAAPGDRAERAGLWAAGLGATLLTLATFANLWMAETLWNALWTAGLIALVRWWRRPTPAMALVAGILIGLATLARSLPLFFVPALLLWMLWHVRSRRGLGQAALLALSCAAVIAPWTIRNALAYDALIPVETGFSYNLWAFSEPALDLGQIGAQLSAIPNPAARAAYAEEQGMALLRADPAIVLRKLGPNTLYLWRVKPIEDRFLQENYYSDVPAAYFTAALLFDDLWYLLILGLAAWGLGRAARDGRLALALLWVSYVWSTTALTHGEARYRHFILPVLLAYAGAALARQPSAAPRWQRTAALAVGGGLVALVLAWYPWRWAGATVARSWTQWRAERAWDAGDQAIALGLYAQAAEAAPSPDSLLLLGQRRIAAGDPAGGLAALEAAYREKRDYPPAVLALGGALIDQGQPEAARALWLDSYQDQQTLLAWAWQHPARAAPQQIAVGDGLDLGWVSGMHAPETLLGATARWTDGSASLRIAGGPGRLLALRLADPRPPPAGQSQLCAGGLGCHALQLDASWRIVWLLLPPHAGEWEISLRSTPWQPAALNPGAPARQLGIVVDWAQSRPLAQR